ncbi:MAG: rhomboid family intramembrane serine protease [Fimbriimonadales bacterium]
MIPLKDDKPETGPAWVTYTLVLLLLVVYLWDRRWRLLGEPLVFSDLAARPLEIKNALKGGDKEPLITIFTSNFLHATPQHIIGNLLFLSAFGPRVESWMGPFRFVLYYLFFGVAAVAAQIWVNPNSGIPMLGASGAIAGVMGAYLLLFPAARIQTIVPPLFFFKFELPAWLLLSMWFLFQIFLSQPGVANWAHVGGFLAGMVVVLIMDRWPKDNGRSREALST